MIPRPSAPGLSLLMLFAVALGGALGSVTRFAIGLYGSRVEDGAVPYATLLINVGGSFLLGVLLRVLPQVSASPELAAALTVGFCGGFTTFSTFSAELARMVQLGSYWRAASYAVASVLLSLAATFAGFAAARGVLGSGR